jgi:hypothetical protein
VLPTMTRSFDIAAPGLMFGGRAAARPAAPGYGTSVGRHPYVYH